MKRENIDAVGKWIKGRMYFWAVVGVVALILATLLPAKQITHAGSGDWTTYLGNDAHTGFNAAETVITPATAPNLQLKWSKRANGPVSAQAAVANGLVYWGSWDGFEHATNPNTGTDSWATNLGQATNSGPCGTSHRGVVDTATIAMVTINGTPTSVAFVGSGLNFFALNAMTGAIIWQTALGSVTGDLLWGSPTVYQGSIYIGMSSFSDCPEVQGQFFKLDAVTGTLQATYNLVPNGCLGGTVWSAPTIDDATGVIYLSTGNSDTCSTPEPLAVSLVELRASDLSLLYYWRVPVAEQTPDSDFGATPTLFTTSTGLPMVGIANKNGIFYAFRRTPVRPIVDHGPVWRATISTGKDTISSAAWDGQTLYVGGTDITVNGTSCLGSVVALNPDNGSIKWRHCLLDGPVIGAIMEVPGLVVAGEGTYIMVLDATTGNTLFSFQDTNTNSQFWGWATISNGFLYIGNHDGIFYAFAPPS